MFPDKRIHVLEACKGADRLRAPPPDVQKSIAPPIGSPWGKIGMMLRKCVGIHGKIGHNSAVDINPTGVLARLLITVFAAQKAEEIPIVPKAAGEGTDHQFSEEPPMAKRPRMNPCDDKDNASSEATVSDSSQSLEPVVDSPKVHATQQRTQATIDAYARQSRTSQGNPVGQCPARSKIAFESHRGSEGDVCPTCFEQSRPKIARPSHLSEPRQFNDLITIGGVQWTNPEGTKFMRTNCISGINCKETAS